MRTEEVLCSDCPAVIRIRVGDNEKVIGVHSRRARGIDEISPSANRDVVSNEVRCKSCFARVVVQKRVSREGKT